MDVHPREVSGVLNAAVVLLFTYFGGGNVCLYLFRLSLVWSCGLSPPLLLKGVKFLGQSLNLISPTRNPISMLAGSVTPQTEAQKGERTGFHSKHTQVLNSTRHQHGDSLVVAKGPEVVVEILIQMKHRIFKSQLSNSKKIPPSKPPCNCMKAMARGDLD